jgi:hypothetical protein
MPHYENACIYKIKHNEDYDDENIYIGSTCDIIKRRYNHKNCCNNENNKKYNYPIYQYIRENGGWDSWIVIKIHDYKCNSKSELEVEERRTIDLLKPKLNKNIPTRSDKEWREANKELIAEKLKEYQEANKEVLVEKRREYQEENKEVIAEKKKKYYEENKQHFIEKARKYQEENKEVIAEKLKEWRKANKDIIAERNKQKCKCDICGAEVTKNHLKRHKKSQKCLSVKNNV